MSLRDRFRRKSKLKTPTQLEIEEAQARLNNLQGKVDILSQISQVITIQTRPRGNE